MQSVSRNFLVVIFVTFAISVLAQTECPPLYIFTGETSGDFLGGSVAGAGDVNNDGFDDVIVGASLSDFGGINAGRAYVFSGLNGGTLYVFTGEASNDRFGAPVASAGDVNNDGFDDLIVGATGAGRVYVYSGQNGNMLYSFIGESDGDGFGLSVSGAGDVNNDGFNDLVIGAPGHDSGGNDAGRVYVYSGQSGVLLYTITGKMILGNLGNSVSGAGDVNNDGYDDIIVGEWLNNVSGDRAGRAYLYSGQTGELLYTFTGEAADDFFGWSVSDAGDANSDGFDDVIVGAYGNDSNGDGAGKVYVYSGQSGGLLYTYAGESAGDFFGWSVSGAGDVNNDGFDDLVIGAINNDAAGQDAGRAYVYSGQNGNLLNKFTGTSIGGFGDGLGRSVSGAGDVNNDGFADVIVGLADNDIGGRDAGQAIVYACRPSVVCGDVNDDGLVTTEDLTFLINFYFMFGEPPVQFESSDVNGDGMTDISDIISLSNYLNGIGPAPCSASEPPPDLFDPKEEPQGHRTGGY